MAVITEVPGIGRKLLVPEISTEVRLRLYNGYDDYYEVI